MIDKVIRIKNVGCFNDYGAFGDVSFRGVNIIFGENAKGKTTLSAILRSLQTGDANHIAERRTLGSDNEQSVELRVSDSTKRYSDGSWNETVPEIVVFDPTFIEDNVYSGAFIKHEHKKNLYNVVVGKQAVELAKGIERIDSDVRRLNEQMRDTSERIRELGIGAMDVDTFVTLPEVADVDNRIRLAAQTVATLEKAQDIAVKGELSIIPMIPFPEAELAEVLGRTLEDLSADAVLKIRQHIHQCMDNQGEAWISHGMKYIKDERCPFCTQLLTGIELVDAYRGFFGSSYRALKSQTDGLHSRVSEDMSDRALMRVQGVIENNRALVTFWREFVEVQYPELSFKDIQGPCQALRECLDRLLSKKRESPLEKIKLHDSILPLRNKFQEVMTAVIAYNDLLGSVNSAIGKKKAEAKTGDLRLAMKNLGQFKLARLRHQEKPAQRSKQYIKLQREKTQLEMAKEEAKESLDDLTETLFETYQKTINAYLSRFGATFSISGLRRTYIGGTPNAGFALVINSTEVDVSDPDTPPGEACFRNTLSSGDKSTLAFAFFLAKLDQESELEKKIIVFDDPVSSLDHHRKTCTAQQILSYIDKATQIVVMSHDLQFIKAFWDGCDQSRVKALEIIRAERGSEIVEWDIEEALQEDYYRNCLSLYDYLEKGAEGNDLSDIARLGRPILEGNLRRRFPRRFRPREQIGQFMREIEAAQQGDELFTLKGDFLSELDALNEYFSKYHHDEAGALSIEEPNDTELRAYVRRLLDFIKGLPIQGAS